MELGNAIKAVSDYERTKPRKETAVERQDALLDELMAASDMTSWNSLVDDALVPGDIYPALAAQRPELLALATPRAMSADEVASLYKLIAALIKTNSALRRHAEQLANMTRVWTESFKALRAVGLRIDAFANFRQMFSDDIED